MLLRDWIALDQTEREEFQSECRRRGTVRTIGEIADEAAKLLKEELALIPQVTDVSTAGDRTAKRAWLEVSTLLPEHEKLAGIPTEFAGFPVVQFGVADRKRQFLERLAFTLRAANYSEPELQSWLNRHDESLNKIGSVYYLESPDRWIAEVLVASRAKSDLVGTPLIELHGKLWDVLTIAFSETNPDCVSPHSEAMLRLRASLQKVFADYGVNL